ncbi:cytochrome P450 [Streptomyces tsukubensis]|nr:cytochrome P450 [Streptomyces tsukubensis]
MVDIDELAENFDPWDIRLAGDSELFWAVVERMRQKGPVLRSTAQGGFWIITGHDEVLRANKDWETYTSAQGVTIPSNPDVPKLAPIEVDPPVHREWRRMLNPSMSPAAMARHEPAIRSIAVELMDQFVERGECDLATDFAWQFVPASLFQVLLGVPVDQVERTRRLVHRVVSFEDLDEQTGARGESLLEQQNKAFADLNEWARGFLQWRQERPRVNDVTDALLHGEVSGKPLSLQEKVNTLILLVLAGMETTSSSISAIALHLIEDPSLRHYFHGPEAPVETAIEELLRHGSISFGLTRVTTCDVEVGGQVIPAGERVFLLWASGNRDPEVFQEPARFDIHRRPNAHLAFGAGPHRCMGANFAKAMLKVATTEMVARLPELRLDPDGVAVHPPGVTRSTRSLPVLFRPTSPSSGLRTLESAPAPI